MRIRTVHRITSIISSLSIILSFFISVCSMDMMEKMCNQMMMGHGSNVEMHHISDSNMMKHESPVTSTDCDALVDCDCVIDREAIVTIVPTVHLKTSITPILVFVVQNPRPAKLSSVSIFNIFLSKSYSPPPLFLANESFLI